MIDPNVGILAAGAIELFRQNAPWLAEKAGAAAISQAVKEAWEFVRKKLSSPGAQEAIQKVESEPAKPRNWDTLKNHLLDALEQDAGFREQLSRLLPSQSFQQTIVGDQNKQAAVLNSPGAQVKL